MTSPLEDGAAEVITEIDYDNIRHTHLLSGNFKFTGIVVLDPKKWSRWTNVANFGHHYKSEEVHIPRKKRIGLLFQSANTFSDVFLPFDSIPKAIKAELPEHGPEGNSPHCRFCTNPSTHKKYEWPLDPTYSTHRVCFNKFQTFVEDVYNIHHSVTLAHAV